MVATRKKEQVDSLARSMSKSKTVGLVSISNIPSSQFQQMRKSLKEIEINVARNNLIRLAIKKAKLAGLDSYVDSPTGVITSDIDPFQLEKFLSERKVNTNLKPGAIAPKDIVIPEGDTPFPPGPIIGELQRAGIKAKIEGGKIVVTEDSLVVKEGEAISEDAAGVLARLDIKPVEISLKLRVAYEDGVIYTSEVLHIDRYETTGKIVSAHQNSLNLALNAGIYNKFTLPLLVQTAFANARNLCINTEIINEGTVEFFLSKANAQINALKSVLPPEVLEGAKEEKPERKQEKQAEEVKPERKPENERKKAETKEKKKPEEKPREKTEEVKKEAKVEEKPQDKKTEESKTEQKEELKGGEKRMEEKNDVKEKPKKEESLDSH